MPRLSDARSHRRRFVRDSRDWWIDVRLVGWALIASWQVLSLVSEFVPLDLEQRWLRITGKVLGLVGLALVAYGFERLMHASGKTDATD